MLSIIIPTLNEEKYLPHLLSSIKKQKIRQDYEIIVADGGSEDKTVKIAKNFGCKIVDGGKSPAEGRNNGAEIAKGDLLLFLDADTLLPRDFFAKTFQEFKRRNLDVAGFCLKPRSNRKIHKIFYEVFYNWIILLFEKFLAHASQAILVKKEIFEKIGGFDKEIKFAEDHSFARKAKKIGKFGILRQVWVFSSIRRFEKEGWVPLYLKYVFAEIYMILFGDIKRDIFRYKFGNFK